MSTEGETRDWKMSDYSRVSLQGNLGQPDGSQHHNKAYSVPEPAQTRLEGVIYKVQAMRDRVCAAETQLSNVTARLIGDHPVNGREAPSRKEPNGLFETLDFNVDLLETDLSQLYVAIERLREGL